MELTVGPGFSGHYLHLRPLSKRKTSSGKNPGNFSPAWLLVAFVLLDSCHPQCSAFTLLHRSITGINSTGNSTENSTGNSSPVNWTIASSTTPTPLALGKLTSGSVVPPQLMLYSVSLTECWVYKQILLELISPSLALEDSASGNDSQSPSSFSAGPQAAPAAPAAAAGPSQPPVRVRAPRAAMPILLVNTNGRRPTVKKIRTNEYSFNDNTTAVDAPDFLAQQPVQYGLMDIAPNSTTTQWILAVYQDPAIGISSQFQIRASCSATPPCPANCGGPSQGQCLEDGRCTCSASWGGASCTTVLNDLKADNGTVQLLAPGQWLYYYFQIPQPDLSYLPGPDVLLEVSRTSGDLLVLMKPEDQGLLKHGLVTEFDYLYYSDFDGYRHALPYQHIFWHDARPGGVYIGILNLNNDQSDPSNLTMSLQFQTNTGSDSTALCPRQCSYPAGTCAKNASGYPVCTCNDGRGGDFCESEIYTARLGYALRGILPPLETVYFRSNAFDHCAGNITVSIQYQGGHLFAMFATNGTIPTLDSDNVAELPILTNFEYQEYDIVFGNDTQMPVVVGLYNSDRYVNQKSTVQIIMMCSDDTDSSSFVNSPYMVTVFCLVGVFLTGLLAMLLRRFLPCFSRTPPPDAPIRTNELTSISTDPLRPMQGVPKEVVASFPVVPFSADVNTSLHETQCAVCLGDYEEGELLKKLPLCHHMFHVSCISQWLAYHTTCPFCRCSLERISVLPREQPSEHGVSTVNQHQGGGGQATVASLPEQHLLVTSEGREDAGSSSSAEPLSGSCVPGVGSRGLPGDQTPPVQGPGPAGPPKEMPEQPMSQDDGRSSVPTPFPRRDGLEAARSSSDQTARTD